MKALLLYSSREGQTKKILEFIDNELTDYQCDLVDLHQTTAVEWDLTTKCLLVLLFDMGI